MALHPRNGNHKLWIVTRPTAQSELVDILFQADAREFALQVRGGLDPEEILGWFDNRSEANQIALQALTVARGEQR